MKEPSTKPVVTIYYCTQCRWLLRAAWIAQELLTTFEEDLQGLQLSPSSGGRFDIVLGQDTVLWSRKQQGRFPEAKEVKQALRDQISPARSLGHSDR